MYLDGPGAVQKLVWLDRKGDKIGEVGEEQDAIYFPALSPDGRHVAVMATERSNVEVWVWNIARDIKTRVSSAEGLDYLPVWSPSGEQVAFSSARAGNFRHLPPRD